MPSAEGFKVRGFGMLLCAAFLAAIVLLPEPAAASCGFGRGLKAMDADNQPVIGWTDISSVAETVLAPTDTSTEAGTAGWTNISTVAETVLAPTDTSTEAGPATTEQGGVCSKCNVPTCLGGCACDNSCRCISPCEKCNQPKFRGGCACDRNCDCIDAPRDLKCRLPVGQGGCRCDRNLNCI